MELIERIKNLIKTSTEEEVILAQEKRRFATTLKESGIQKAVDRGVRKIGREGLDTLVADVGEGEFLRLVTSRRPEEIPYERVNMRDEFVAADFYAGLDKHTYIKLVDI